MADLTILRSIAAKTGLGLSYISKDEKISIILEKISTLVPDAILKGGTAINRVYLSKLGVSRFSEDLDLDFVTSLSLDEKIKYLKEKMKHIEGFEVSSSKLLHRTLRFDCYYKNELGQRDRVIIEYYLTTKRWIKIEKILVKSPFVESYPVVFKVYSIEDLIARKLMALHNRLEGKDMYDLFYSLDLKFDKKTLFEILDELIKFYKISKVEFAKKLLVQLERAKGNAIYIGNSTNHFIPHRLRPNWKIFIATLKMKIEKLLGLSTKSIF